MQDLVWARAPKYSLYSNAAALSRHAETLNPKPEPSESSKLCGPTTEEVASGVVHPRIGHPTHNS